MSKGVKMLDLLSRSYVQAGLSILGLMIVSMSAYFVLSRLRDLSTDDHALSTDLKKNFEEMRREGDIDEKEFRNIQSLLDKEQKSSL